MDELDDAEKQEGGRWANNRVENSHLPFRRRERAMLRFRQMKSLQKFASVYANSQNYFSLERPPHQSAGSAWFDESRLGAATEMVPAWVDELLA